MDFTIFPYGATQTLKIASLELTLDWWEFDGDSDGELGYERIRNVSQQIASSKSQFGASILEGQFFESEYLFKWDLNLTNEKLFLLQAIYDKQQTLFKSKQDGRIRLLDQRFIFMEENPRTRAKIGDLVIDPPPPTGHIFFWSQFNILLELESDFSKFFMLPSDGMKHKVSFAAVELDLVPVSEDL